MSDRSGIEWTDATWNPVTGCTKVTGSPGCDHCYAETFAERFRGTPGHYFERGFDVQLRPEKLDHPLRWRRPRRIFVNSMSDLFHDSVPDEYIEQVWTVMALAPQHTFQVLTKRHGRMRSLLSNSDFRENVQERYSDNHEGDWAFEWPLPNVWVGVSAENQRWADIRIPALLDTPAAVRFVSAEPLLGPADLSPYLTEVVHGSDSALAPSQHVTPGLDWVIVGGESGRSARPMHPAWVRSLRDQCVDAGVAFLFKQWGDASLLVDKQGDVWTLGTDRLLHTRETAPFTREHVEKKWGPLRPASKKIAGRELDGRTWDEYPGGSQPMSAPKRIQLRRTAGWRKPEGAIVVARPTKWGNPFVVGMTYSASGPNNEWSRLVKIESRSQAVAEYRRAIEMGHVAIPSDLSPLRGHDLACWCPLDQDCHADVLLEVANG